MNNKRFNLNHRSNYYLTNNYEDNFDNNEWNHDDIIDFNDNIPINDDYNDYKYSKKYSFPQKNGFTFKQNKYK